jgi:hypothetical protein
LTRNAVAPPIRFSWAAFVAAALIGCGSGAAARPEIRSAKFPGTVIECRAEIFIAVDTCRGWGEKLLAGSPDLAGATNRLVLTYRGGTARCAAEFLGSSGAILGSAAAVCPF